MSVESIIDRKKKKNHLDDIWINISTGFSRRSMHDHELKNSAFK